MSLAVELEMESATSRIACRNESETTIDDKVRSLARLLDGSSGTNYPTHETSTCESTRWISPSVPGEVVLI